MGLRQKSIIELSSPSAEQGHKDTEFHVDRRANPTVTRRTERVVVRELGDETLVYDLDTNDVHCLTGLSAKVWHSLTVASTLNTVSRAVDADTATTEAAIEQLNALNLLSVAVERGMSRRTLFRGAAVGGGTLIVLPVIETILAPAAYAACSTDATPVADDLFTRFSAITSATNGNTYTAQSPFRFGSTVVASGTPTALPSFTATPPKNFFSEISNNRFIRIGFTATDSTRVHVVTDRNKDPYPVIGYVSQSNATLKITYSFSLLNTSTNQDMTVTFWTVNGSGSTTVQTLVFLAADASTRNQSGILELCLLAGSVVNVSFQGTGGDGNNNRDMQINTFTFTQ